jgi:putative ABC transport system permease protein
MRRLPFEYAVRNMGRSPWRLVLSLAGSVLVVVLVLAAGGFVRGMNKTLDVSSDNANVVVLGAGSEESIERSEIMSKVAGEISASVPGIRSRAGEPYVSAEVHMAVPLGLTQDLSRAPLAVLRGVTPRALLVHTRVQLIEGRFPEIGRDEMMVGALAPAKMGESDADLGVGKQLWFDNHPWTIVGRFVAPGTTMEAEIWCPLTDLKVAAKRDTDSCVIVTLDTESGAEFGDVDAFCRQRLDLELAAMTETEYYSKLNVFYRPVRVLAWVTAGLIGLGGLLGGLNTMYAAFAARVREFGMLQSLGYTRASIIVSLIQESVLTTLAGALVACVIALVILSGVAVRMSMGAFTLTMDAPVMSLGLLTGLTLGIVGALPPAWRCLRLPIGEALKTG